MSKESLIEKMSNIKWYPVVLNGVNYNHFVSADGQVLRCGGYENTKRGPVYYPERLLTPYLGKDGNLQVTMRYNGKPSTHYVHTLVATAFIPNIKNQINVRHIDGNKLNNNYKNLEWSSPKGISLKEMERRIKKERNLKSDHFKYSEDDIRNVCKLLEENTLTMKEISKLTGVHPQMVSNLKRGASWKHIVRQYNIPKPSDENNSRNSKYTEEQIHQVCKLLEENKLTYPGISKATGVTVEMICRIKRKRNWTSISSQYNIPK